VNGLSPIQHRVIFVGTFYFSAKEEEFEPVDRCIPGTDATCYEQVKAQISFIPVLKKRILFMVLLPFSWEKGVKDSRIQGFKRWFPNV